jgi:2-haloacid dehalogenase
MPPARSRRTIAIFDIGGVLIEWNPRHLYRKLFEDEQAMEDFLASVCTTEWNARQDAGRTFEEATRALMPLHADKRPLIDAWRSRFDEMIPGAIPGSVDVLAELRRRGVPLYAISNFSAETFPSQRRRFGFFDWFDDIVVSGEVGVIKPDARIFRILLDRHRIEPAQAVFVDDVEANVAAARALGIHGILFRSAEDLRDDLAACGLLPQRR